MFTLKVSGMTCGGCINAVTRAVQAQDPRLTASPLCALQAAKKQKYFMHLQVITM